MPQPNFQDCGLFTIANMVEVLAGRHPAKSCWDVTQMRSLMMNGIFKEGAQEN